MRENRSGWQIRLASLKRMTMWFLLSRRLDLVLLTEFPKSGGSWLGEMLSYIFELPFPRNVSPRLKPSIMHGHFRYSRRFGKVIGVMRDGRDVMVSAYFHFLLNYESGPRTAIDRFRAKMEFDEYDNVEENLPLFIEYMFTKFSLGSRLMDWRDFVRDFYLNDNVLVVKYENLLNEPEKELMQIAKYLDRPASVEKIRNAIDRFSFQKMSTRMPGEEDRSSFLRKGIAGDWKNYFTQEAKEVFVKHAGKELILMGYEKDNDWCQ